jgi:hypothetical protein
MIHCTDVEWCHLGTLGQHGSEDNPGAENFETRGTPITIHETSDFNTRLQSP